QRGGERPLRRGVPRTPRDGAAVSPLGPTSLELLRLQARRGGPGGICFGARRIGWAEVAAAAADLATWLGRRGLAGRHVAVMAANEPALVAALYALWGIEAAAVPLGVRLTGAEAAPLLTHARASALVCDAARVDVARDAAAAAGVPAYVLEADL